MIIYIDDKEYDVKFTFRVCRVLRTIADASQLFDKNGQVDNGKAMDMLFDKGAKLVHTAIRENKLKPIPSIDKIETYFDENKGAGMEFLSEFLVEMVGHITPDAAKEIDNATKGN